jgi:anaerobic selenocysteine-containing dehydrogenase
LKSKKRFGRIYDQPVDPAELDDAREDDLGRIFTRAPKPAGPNIVPLPLPDGDAEGRRLVGVNINGEIKRGFPTPSGKLEFFSTTLANWGWPELAIPIYFKSHVHKDNLAPDQTILISTFRLPVQIHTRSANSKWLDEIAHNKPAVDSPEPRKQTRRAHRRSAARGN